MQTQRRTVITALGALALGGLGIDPSKAQAQAPMKDAVAVRIAVKDEAGNPIPYVTVWGFVATPPELARRAGFPAAQLGADDLWRITVRHGSLHEIVSDVGDKPVPGLDVAPLGNAMGLFSAEVDDTEQTGGVKNHARPDPLVFGYTFMKRGYFPGKLEFSVPRAQTSVQASITLKRNPAEAVETAAYLQTFARVRHALSQRLDRSVTPENQARVQGFVEQLEDAAQQALAAGDNKAAARIYARMRYMPRLTQRFDGSLEISGFSQDDARSPQAQRALDLAYQLDPQNLYVWMNTVDRQRNDPPGATQEQIIRANLAQLEKIIAQFGDATWPEIHLWQAGSHEALGDYARARALYVQAAQFEPKFTDWPKTLADMKTRMKLKKVPIPKGW